MLIIQKALSNLRYLKWITIEIYNKQTLVELKMSQSSVQKALAVLLEKDFITEVEGVFGALDPTIVSYVKMFG